MGQIKPAIEVPLYWVNLKNLMNCRVSILMLVHIQYYSETKGKFHQKAESSQLHPLIILLPYYVIINCINCKNTYENCQPKWAKNWWFLAGSFGLFDPLKKLMVKVETVSLLVRGITKRQSTLASTLSRARVRSGGSIGAPSSPASTVPFFPC